MGGERELGARRREQGARSEERERLDIAEGGRRQEQPMKFLKRRLRSLALAGRKCAPDAGLSLSRRAAALNSKT